MSIRNEQRKHGISRGSPRCTCTAKASRINRHAVKSGCACEWAEGSPAPQTDFRLVRIRRLAARANHVSALLRPGRLDGESIINDLHEGCKGVRENQSLAGSLGDVREEQKDNECKLRRMGLHSMLGSGFQAETVCTTVRRPKSLVGGVAATITSSGFS